MTFVLSEVAPFCAGFYQARRSTNYDIREVELGTLGNKKKIFLMYGV